MARRRENEVSPQQIFLWVFQIVIVVLFAFVLGLFLWTDDRACIGQSNEYDHRGRRRGTFWTDYHISLEIPKGMM